VTPTGRTTAHTSAWRHKYRLAPLTRVAKGLNDRCVTSPEGQPARCVKPGSRQRRISFGSGTPYLSLSLRLVQGDSRRSPGAVLRDFADDDEPVVSWPIVRLVPHPARPTLSWTGPLPIPYGRRIVGQLEGRDVMAGKFEPYKDKSGKFRFRLNSKRATDRSSPRARPTRPKPAPRTESSR